MAIVSKLAFAALAGLFAANFVSQASAQDSPARDAAIHKCINEAQARFPNVSDDNTMRARTDVYRSCMRSAGQNP
ncbi:MAG: hypothetical protein WDO17_14580 [Alphaproteobacteria bacterium]